MYAPPWQLRTCDFKVGWIVFVSTGPPFQIPQYPLLLCRAEMVGWTFIQLGFHSWCAPQWSLEDNQWRSHSWQLGGKSTKGRYGLVASELHPSPTSHLTPLLFRALLAWHLIYHFLVILVGFVSGSEGHGYAFLKHGAVHSALFCLGSFNSRHVLFFPRF